MFDFLLNVIGLGKKHEHEECDGLKIDKIKYSNNNIKHKKIWDDYGLGAISDKILLEISLQ